MRLAQYTHDSVLATLEFAQGEIEGHCVSFSKKASQGSETKIWELLEELKETYILVGEGSLICPSGK